MKITEKREDERVIIPAPDFLKDKVKKIKYKKGFNNSDIDSHHKTSGVYAKILFRLLELMVMDVIAGHTVYFNKRTKARIYVDYREVLFKNILSAEALAKPHIPRVDFSKTKMRTPFIAFDTGYKNSSPCLVKVPEYLYIDLINQVNEGKRFSKSMKDFFFNRAYK